MFDTVPQRWVTEFADSANRPTVVHYVSGDDGSSVLLLVGPFASEQQARVWVGRAQDVLLERGELEVALAVRVTKLLGHAASTRPGDLNRQLHVQV